MILFHIAFGIACLIVPCMQHRTPIPDMTKQHHTPIRDMTILHAWNNLEYGFECPEDREYAIKSRSYIEDGFKRPYDVDMAIDEHGKRVIFICTPRIVSGMPYTLSTVSDKQGKYGPLLMPFPNFEAHSERNSQKCDRIISAFRMFSDQCGNLWVIDNGRNFSAQPTLVCPPKILVYEIRTKKLVLKYEIPKEQYNDQTVYNGIIVSIDDPPPRGRCEKGKAYLTDARGYSFLVFDFSGRQRRHLKSWVIYNDLFKMDPAFAQTTINGETFNFTDGLYTSSPDTLRGLIYLHSYTSNKEIRAKLKDVNNPLIWQNNSSGNQELFETMGTRRTQCPVQAMDFAGNNLYFSEYEPLSILSWNPDTSYKQANFKTVVVNNETLAFVAGMKVRIDRDGNEVLLTLSNNLQKLNTGSIKLSDINYRVMIVPTKDLQAGRRRDEGPH